MEESTVPIDDFSKMPLVPTGTVGLLRPSELGEGVLGESGGGIRAAVRGASSDVVPNRGSMVIDRGPKGGLESL